MKNVKENKLIAEFMETKSSLVDGFYFGNDGVLYLPENLRYHFSWDWLMPVVKKILSKGYTLKGVKKMKNVELMLTTCNIYKTHNAVVEFITWYNENN